MASRARRIGTIGGGLALVVVIAVEGEILSAGRDGFEVIGDRGRGLVNRRGGVNTGGVSENRDEGDHEQGGEERDRHVDRSSRLGLESPHLGLGVAEGIANPDDLERMALASRGGEPIPASGDLT